jgi:ribosomal protein L37E
MKITHNISISTTSEIRSELEELGITVGEGFVSFKIEESDERWIKLKPKILEWHAIDIPDTTFSDKELSESEWLEMLPEWHHGYPQPEDDFKYLSLTYDLSNYCSKCGIGAVQKENFRMQKEPKWGKRGILQLNWVFDQYFVLPDVWRDIFKMFGIPCLPVIHHRTGKNLNTVLQLSNLENTELENIDRYPHQVCNECGRKKYLPIAIGRFPKLRIIPKSHISRTNEYFGSGRRAFNAIVVSHELYKQIRKYKLKGVSFNATY